MAEAVVSFLVERVGDYIIQEGRSLFGVGNQVRRAHRDLVFIKGFLKDADAKRRDSEAIRTFVAEIRDAAYDLEDVIEAFVLKVDSRRKGGIKNVLKRLGSIFVEGVLRYKIGSEIGVITITISDLKQNLQTYGIKEISDSSTSLQLCEAQQLLRRTYTHVIDRNVVGLEDSVHELVGHLVKEEHRHRVVSIIGMGGSGKTTIAKQVYHHKEVTDHFDCLAWVCISQQYQVRDVLERIYVKLLCPTKEERDEIAKLKDDEIPGRLSRLQNEQKCLIVLDDIWKRETWDLLKAAFECHEDSKSRILLTTRNEQVASHADENGFRYRPPPLTESESWKLFEKIAMSGRKAGIGAEVYTKMEELGKEMVQHCKGLPLAIIVLAGLLARKNTIKDWINIQENVGVYISRGFGRQEEEHAYASWVLALSYDDLPYHLKPCFLYLGHFPEDHEIQVKSLTRLWIAEGFIFLTQQRQGSRETMEDVAYNWLNELVERCVIQVGERSSTLEKIKSCRMHDLLRDLCLRKAEEENFLQVVKGSHKNEAMHPVSSSMVTIVSPMGKIRRLAIYLDENDDKLVPSREERGGQLRSLLYFGPNDYNWFPKQKELIPSMFKDFKLLRVLRIEGMNDREEKIELPREIGKMVHLRFLSLRRSNIRSFPPFLGNLICLQTLDFRVIDDNDMFIPNVICKMNKLRHLYLPWYYWARGKLQLSTLGDLLTLNSVSNGYCDWNDLAKLGNLRKLRIRLSSSQSKNLEKILDAAGCVLNGIRSLRLHNEVGVESGAEVSQIVARCGQIYKLALTGPTLELPKELFHSHSNLTKLLLSSCALKDDQMAVLEKLPNLKSLDLWNYVFEEENTKVLVFSAGSFPRLQFLRLVNLLGITEWRVEEGAMPCLCKLVIYDCRGLSTVPDGLRHLTTLKELKIQYMPKLFCSKLEEGGEDFHKVQHIPSLIIQNPRG
ncbi:putative P-loop containing nucleoside triphosphate hydrolase, leucine-rich repeat domain, L [Rosa chinensis]|uniref:Putative P-loop containing nucleoside triphosphate hydrolase, leucine-rich repeat domain, L n=1 Tax=Rosa chinensis TaxID=74649 RepID=A0A2P6QR80_ROSCH|nr:putative disease resistance protein At1g50180 [Rosa chinensis]XP_024192346.1 putative disease resistance protein At1g50180 [Rosa chinensis]PRQ36694.1 putative P-loop containing nucleoside triphosphate hydrolase, leucine-rich repeat domain, L [Rosa chinensis]